MASAAVQKNDTRDDFKKQQQLREARQSGQAAPEIDAATGKMINPHNPQFITEMPWYLQQQGDGPTLSHQKAWNLKEEGTKDWYIRGTKGDKKTKFAKGACENCGAMTHTKRDCTERPRKVGAKYTGKDLAPDEHVQELNLDYDGKRDSYNGYNPDTYKEVIQEYERIEMERKRQRAVEMDEKAKKKRVERAERGKRREEMKAKRAEKKAAKAGAAAGGDADSDTDTDTDSDSDSDSDIESDDEEEGTRMRDFKNSKVFETKDAQQGGAGGVRGSRTTTRNLRIREDTAKYLLNLDTSSAFYDPKSRSMRDNPLKHLKDEEQHLFKGDNASRTSGDCKGLEQLERFAWEAYKHGEQTHAIALPTQAHKLQQVFKDRTEQAKEEKKEQLLGQYGGAEHLQVPEVILNAESEQYVEYSRDGRVVKGQERKMASSKYMEDQYPGNHSSVYGSWFCNRTLAWGYSCCKATARHAYCTAGSEPAALTADAPAAPPAELPPAAAEHPPSPKGVEAPPGSPKKPEAPEKPQSPKGVAAPPVKEEPAKESPPKGKKRKKESSSSSSSSDSDSDSSSSSSSSDKKKKKKQKTGKEGEGLLAGVSAGKKKKKDDKADKLKDRNKTSAFGHNLEDVAQSELDPKKLEKAKKKLLKEQKQGVNTDERSSKYNSLGANDVNLSAEEYEAYLQTKQKFDDPMRHFTS